MKKIVLFFAITFLSANLLFAQKLINYGDDEQESVVKNSDTRSAFYINDTYMSVGVGFGSLILNNSIGQNSTNESVRNTGPFYAKIENAVSDRLGFGMNIAYSNVKYSRDYINYLYQGNATIQIIEPEEVDINLVAILARINWHYGSNNKLDPYMGLGMGYRNISYRYIKRSKYNTSDDFKNLNMIPLGFEFTIGARFLFNESWGGFTEFGFAQSVGQFGLVYRIRN
jgi:opacity protein-like surface antigen